LKVLWRENSQEADLEQHSWTVLKHRHVYPQQKCLGQQKRQQSGGRSFMMQPTLKLSRKV